MKEQTKECVSLHILKRERGHDVVHDRATTPAPTKHHINTITHCPLRVLRGRSEPPHSPLLSAAPLVQKARISLVLLKATPKSSSNSSAEVARIHL